MRAALAFVQELDAKKLLENVVSVQCQLQGSLAATGIGHHTPNAIVAGLQGLKVHEYDKSTVCITWKDVETSATGRVELSLNGSHNITFSVQDILFEPYIVNSNHTNCMVLSAKFTDGNSFERTFLSPGGGSVLQLDNNTQEKFPIFGEISSTNDYVQDISDYNTAQELLELCKNSNLTISEAIRRQEKAHCRGNFTDNALNQLLDHTWQTMNQSIESGLTANSKGSLMPGDLGVLRRAPKMYSTVKKMKISGSSARIEMLSCYALAVNEQNAEGGRIVTAPTAGSAGVIPAVIRYLLEEGVDDKSKAIQEFLLTASAIGFIIKQNGSISGAECGCQAEIGSACAMAAAGLVAMRGGTPEQIENAAEIALEHHFGLTCDPVGGLVLIPCIERNAIAANTAVTAGSLALAGDGSHKVTLDMAIETMRQTGIDMNDAYKETSRAGLATIVEC
jgi:L-serine dehydratase